MYLRYTVLLLVMILSGCASTVVIQNEAQELTLSESSYSLKEVYGQREDTGVSIILAFSGGGTRAAALSYGVLLELRDTVSSAGNGQRQLLDDVKVISAVSGGSFTAAYYGLYGNQIFTDFESKFLYRNIEKEITDRLLSINRVLSPQSRGETARNVYREFVFGDSTYADMRRVNAPMILINASDLSTGARVSFVQDFFNLLCSNLNSMPVANAVAASAGVPVLFEPVVVENYDTCDISPLVKTMERAKDNVDNQEISQALSGIVKLAQDKEHYRYLHLVDGGITDNLGLRSLYEVVELHGGIKSFFKEMGRRSDSKSVLISVDASTDATYGIGLSEKEPNLQQTLNALTDIQLHRYNASTIELIRKLFKSWNDALSTRDHRVDSYFVTVALADIEDMEDRAFFNQIPTSLNLMPEEVDRLIKAGRSLLRNNAEFQRLVKSL